ncbi:MAG: hypothetical protein IAF58_12975 [Leptolyngbya sp.]|nr:hypothetical protein [Candidatus Melainabacteria bacterium]
MQFEWDSILGDDVTVNDVVPYTFAFFVLFLMVRPVFTGIIGGGRGKFGVESPQYSRESPNEAPMYYVLTGIQLLFVIFALWAIFGDHHKASQHDRPKPVFINELVDAPTTTSARNSATSRASVNSQNSKRKKSEHKENGRKHGGQTHQDK